MERLLDFILRSIPLWGFVLIFHMLAGLITGFIGSMANIFMGGTAPVFIITVASGLGGLLFGIWAVLRG